MSTIKYRAESPQASELPEIVQKIEADWPILPSGIWSCSSNQRLTKHLHDLARHCEVKGDARLNRLIGVIDEAINQVIDDNSPPDSRQIETLNRHLEELRIATDVVTAGLKEGDDALTAKRDAMLKSLKQGAVHFSKRRFNSHSEDSWPTFEITASPLAISADSDPYKVAASCGLAGDFDRFIYCRALRELSHLVMRGRMERVIFRQSATLLKEPEHLDVIKTGLRQCQIVGTGLIIEFDLPSLATNLKRARSVIEALAELDIGVAIGKFVYNKTAYKILKYLKADAIRPHRSLLCADEDKVRHLAQRVQSRQVEIILPRVARREQIALHWLELADYFQADFAD
jgi:EAL domain-containing protein (putative c-di-GMP-specific phosphodiesterase class I)